MFIVFTNKDVRSSLTSSTFSDTDIKPESPLEPGESFTLPELELKKGESGSMNWYHMLQDNLYGICTITNKKGEYIVEWDKRGLDAKVYKDEKGHWCVDMNGPTKEKQTFSA